MSAVRDGKNQQSYLARSDRVAAAVERQKMTVVEQHSIGIQRTAEQEFLEKGQSKEISTF